MSPLTDRLAEIESRLAQQNPYDIEADLRLLCAVVREMDEYLSECEGWLRGELGELGSDWLSAAEAAKECRQRVAELVNNETKGEMK